MGQGGHLIFKGAGDEPSTRMIRRCLKAGIRADYLGKGYCRISGPGRKLETISDDPNQWVLPELLTPLTPNREAPVIDKVIPVGERNDTIFRWVASPNVPIESVQLLANFLIEGELSTEEIDSLTKVKERITTRSDECRVQDLYKKDLEYLTMQLRDRYVYRSEINTWYTCHGTHWGPVTEFHVEERLHEIVLTDCGQLARKVPRDGLRRYVTDYLALLRHPLHLGKHVKLAGNGLNFLNGFFVPGDGKLHPHVPQRFVTSTIPALFKANESPSRELRERLFEWCSYDPHALTLLRSALYRMLIRREGLQTGYYVYGPPRSGKSTLADLATYLCGSESTVCATLDQLDNPFFRTHLQSKSLALFSEVQTVQANLANHLKALQGRDLISGAIKNVQEGVQFRFEGTVVLTSNMPPDEALRNSSALLDRFFVLHLRNVVDNPIENFQNYYLERSSQIVNWALQFPDHLVSHLVRTVDFNVLVSSEASDVAEFLTEGFVGEEGGFIARTELVELYTDFCKGRGMRGRFRVGTLIGELITTASALFKIRVTETRPWRDEIDSNGPVEKKKVRGITGLRKRMRGEAMLSEKLQEKRFEGDPFEGCTPGTQIIDLTLVNETSQQLRLSGGTTNHHQEVPTSLGVSQVRDELVVQEQEVVVQTPAVLVQDGSGLVQNGSGLVQNGSGLVQKGPVLVQNGPALVQDGPVLVQGPAVSDQESQVGAGTGLDLDLPMVKLSKEEGSVTEKKNSKKNFTEKKTFLIEW
jgi:phage/plasmid-associated DNA primase